MNELETIHGLKREKENLRRMIDGELNRIAVTDDSDEMIKMMGFLMGNISDYAKISRKLLFKRKQNV